MAQQSPEDQDRALFGLFGDNEEKEGNHETAATYSDDEAQIEAASYLPTPPQHHHGVEHCHGHGHEGQLTPEEAEQQKHAKLHRTHSSSSTSSSDEEDEGEKKKGAKDKIKEKLPGGGEHSSDECGGIEEEKEVGLLDKIKEKLPGKHETKIKEEKKVDESKIEEEKKVDEGRIEEEEKVDESRIEEEKKVSLLDKIKEKLPGHRNKKDLEEEEKKQQY